ncbi:MAG: aspartyl-phosphate phosphatase Spo0E family protein [Firmicutes bacterium]|nr:aspartyl-phosphate phosphatase Spo0E family protein [Bacillota bacterium]
MTPIETVQDYWRSIEQIKILKQHMSALASQRGNLDPEVLKISQQIDEYVVEVQRYWKSQPCDESLTG